MTEEEQQQEEEEHENKRIRPRERARGQLLNILIRHNFKRRSTIPGNKVQVF